MCGCRRARRSRRTTREVQRIEQLIKDDPAVEHFSSYIGNGAPRFFLTLDQQLFADNFGQFVIVTKNLEAREEFKRRMEARFAAPDFADIRVRVVRLENGPPIGYPVQFRVMGDDLAQVARDRRPGGRHDACRSRPENVNFDWNEKVKSVRVEVDQDKRGNSAFPVRRSPRSCRDWLNGIALTQYREGDQLIDVVWRGGFGGESRSLDRLPDLEIPLAGGRHVPLAQVAKLVPVLEEGVIWRRNRLPTMIVRADTRGRDAARHRIQRLNAQLDAVRAKLPPGFRIEMGGSIEESAKGEGAITAVMPLMLVGRDHPADDAVAEHQPHRDGAAHRAAGLDRGDAGAVAVPGAVRFRRRCWASSRCPA